MYIVPFLFPFIPYTFTDFHLQQNLVIVCTFSENFLIKNFNTSRISCPYRDNVDLQKHSQEFISTCKMEQ